MKLVFLLFAMALPEAVAAQEFDGIYRPDEAWAEDWSCDHVWPAAGFVDTKIRS